MMMKNIMVDVDFLAAQWVAARSTRFIYIILIPLLKKSRKKNVNFLYMPAWLLLHFFLSKENLSLGYFVWFTPSLEATVAWLDDCHFINQRL